MSKITISAAFRIRLSDKLMDLGNYAIVSLVLVQFASIGNFSSNALIAGVTFAVLCYIISYVVSK